jgi:hypothetical protein
MTSITAGSVSGNLRQDIRAAMERVSERLQDENGRAFRDHETVAASVEWSTRGLRLIVAS